VGVTIFFTVGVTVKDDGITVFNSDVGDDVSVVFGVSKAVTNDWVTLSEGYFGLDVHPRNNRIDKMIGARKRARKRIAIVISIFFKAQGFV
jgi:hypothetical protein